MRRIIFIIILTSIAFIAGQVARIQPYGTVGFTLLDLVVGLLFILTVVISFQRIDKLKENHLSRPIVFFTVIALFSLLLNPLHLTLTNIVVSLLYLIRFIMYLSIFYLVTYSSKAQKRLIIKAMIISGAMLVCIGLLQYLFYPNLRNLFYLGWDEHLYRLFSTFLDPNFAGCFFALYLLFLFPFIKRAYLKKEKRNLVIYLIISGFTLLSILLTYSRTAFILLLVGLVVFLFVQRKFVLLVVGTLGFILLIFLTSNFKIEGMNPFRTASTNARIESMQDAISIIEKHPVLGVGFNAYQFALFRYGFRSPNTPFPSHALGGTDNSFLFITATMGIVGLLSYLFLLFAMIQDALRCIKEKVFFGGTILSSTIALCVGSLFINALFYPMLLFWIWILYGVSEE